MGGGGGGGGGGMRGGGGGGGGREKEVGYGAHEQRAHKETAHNYVRSLILTLAIAHVQFTCNRMLCSFACDGCIEILTESLLIRHLVAHYHCEEFLGLKLYFNLQSYSQAFSSQRLSLQY